MVSEKSEKNEKEIAIDIFHAMEDTCRARFECFNLEKPEACKDFKGLFICECVLSDTIEKAKIYEDNGNCKYRKKQLRYDAIPNEDENLIELYFFECYYKKTEK